MSQPTAWPPDQLPCGLAPIASAMLMPAPVLKRVPRTLARSQVGPEIARAHLGVALEAAAGQHDRLGAESGPCGPCGGRCTPRTTPSSSISDTAARLVVDRDAGLRRRLVLEIDQARAAAPGLDREAAPELVLAVHLEGLAAVGRLEAHALAAHPLQGLEAAADQDVGELGVAAVVGHPAHVVEELVGRVGAEIDVALLVLGEVVELGEVVDAVEHKRMAPAV